MTIIRRAFLAHYEVTIPLPAGALYRLHAGAAGGGGGGGDTSHAASVARAESNPHLVTLPAGWRPALLLRDRYDDTTDAAADTATVASASTPLLLPAGCLAGVVVQCVVPAPRASELVPTPVCAAIAFRERLDCSACTVALGPPRVSGSGAGYSDCLVLKAPLYYGRSATTTQQVLTTGVSGAELKALRETVQPGGAGLSCRWCRAPLLRAQAATSAGADVAGSSRRRVALMPSSDVEQWSEWWMCHGDETNAVVPTGGVAASPRVLLVSDSCIYVHPADAALERFAARAGTTSTTATADAGCPPPLTAVDATADDDVSCRLCCVRCGCSLGHLQVDVSSRAATAVTSSSWSGSSKPLQTLLHGVSLSVDAPPSASSASQSSSGPVALRVRAPINLRLDKDAVAVGCGGVDSVDGDLLHRYTTLTRVAAQLRSLATSTHCFLVSLATPAAGSGHSPRLSLRLRSWTDAVDTIAQHEGSGAIQWRVAQPRPHLLVQHRLEEVATGVETPVQNVSVQLFSVSCAEWESLVAWLQPRRAAAAGVSDDASWASAYLPLP